MKHLYVLYYFITFSIGVFSLAIATVAYVRSRILLLRYYVYFYLAFTLLVTVNVFSSYLYVNLPEESSSMLFYAFEYLDTLMIHLLVFLLPLFVHELLPVSRRKLRNIIFGGLAIAVYVTFHFLGFLTNVRTGKLEGWGMRFPDIVLVAVVGYTFGIIWHAFRQMSSSSEKMLARKLWLLCGMALIVVSEDIVFEAGIIEVFPILYGSFGLVFAHHFMFQYLHAPQASAISKRTGSGSSDKVDKVEEVGKAGEADTVESVSEISRIEEMAGQFNFSPREKEVLALLLQGRTNAQIGEELYISLNTTKTHIRNIYQKVGVKRRYELLSRFKQFSFPSESHNV
jgi:DNA-binding CsgD family transcriptional regulator